MTLDWEKLGRLAIHDKSAPTQCGVCEPPTPMRDWEALKRHFVQVHLGIYPRIPEKETE